MIPLAILALVLGLPLLYTALQLRHARRYIRGRYGGDLGRFG